MLAPQEQAVAVCCVPSDIAAENWTSVLRKSSKPHSTDEPSLQLLAFLFSYPQHETILQTRFSYLLAHSQSPLATQQPRMSSEVTLLYSACGKGPQRRQVLSKHTRFIHNTMTSNQPIVHKSQLTFSDGAEPEVSTPHTTSGLWCNCPVSVMFSPLIQVLLLLRSVYRTHKITH